MIAHKHSFICPETVHHARRPLSGAAKVAHERRVLTDRARARLAQRDAHAVADTVALLRSAVTS
jgi:hypothetical protein